jgi:acyl-CoA thioester hydrolase
VNGEPVSEAGWRHVEPIAVRWGDMDSMGHVNNAKYFTYCESARMSYFAAIRLPDHREVPTQGPALAAATLNFRRQIRYPADGTGVVVWVDYATGRSNPLPESLRRAIREYEGINEESPRG